MLSDLNILEERLAKFRGLCVTRGILEMRKENSMINIRSRVSCLLIPFIITVLIYYKNNCVFFLNKTFIMDNENVFQ